VINHFSHKPSCRQSEKKTTQKVGGERRRERELCSKRWNVDVLLCKECISIGTIESFKGLKQTPQTKEKQTV